MYTGYIYRHWIINDNGEGKSYVGQVHSAKDGVVRKPETRWKKGKGYAPNKGDKPSHFWNAICKHGWDNFKHDILLKIECATLDELMFWLDEWECYYIWYYDSFYNGYNGTLGGHGVKGLCGEGNGMYGRQHTEESKKLMSMNRPDQNGSENPNAKAVVCLNNNYIFPTAIEAGQWCGVKTVAKAARKGRVAGIHPETEEKLVWMYLDEFNNLHMTDNEINDYIKEKQTQRKPYSQGDKNPRAKRVVCLETMQVFTTIKEASEWCGSSSVGAYLKGKTKYGGLHPNTGQPLHWMYYNDWLELQNN